ncbi:hypothetical protein DACRYDRAFT_101409 [Dacryopinax primogenitus]|uniref:Dystroglycan-type cadherin-like domain-containing protein n=1 Tax=Dacryopinax primogenitus (strain DJM 731) TaxID=1858805 RepID=M5FTC5_DACPD|nr:uncharacterized protein DACRYDRAFT_101409 [Dacryopinax primogenitus]EJT99293.1 hypothetical protein DACRYDRAFT_101409 [Dacryopinax primogenitus]
MARLPTLLITLLTPLALAQSFTLNQPNPSCGITNFTWSYSGITAVQAMNTPLNLTLVLVDVPQGTLPVPLQSQSSSGGFTPSVVRVHSSSGSTSTPASTTTTTSTTTSSSSPTPILETVTVYVPVVTTLTAGNVLITETVEMPVVDTLTLGGPPLPTPRLFARQNPAVPVNSGFNTSLSAPLLWQTAAFNLSSLPTGYYILLAQSFTTTPDLSAQSTPFAVCTASSSPKSGISGGAIAGIVIACLALLIALIILILLMRRRRAANCRAPSSKFHAPPGGVDAWRSSRDVAAPPYKNDYAGYLGYEKDVPLSPMGKTQYFSSPGYTVEDRKVGGDVEREMEMGRRTDDDDDMPTLAYLDRSRSARTPQTSEGEGGDSFASPREREKTDDTHSGGSKWESSPSASSTHDHPLEHGSADHLYPPSAFPPSLSPIAHPFNPYPVEYDEPLRDLPGHIDHPYASPATFPIVAVTPITPPLTREPPARRPPGAAPPASGARALTAIAAQEEDWSRSLPSFLETAPDSRRESTQSTSIDALAEAVMPSAPEPATFAAGLGAVLAQNQQRQIVGQGRESPESRGHRSEDSVRSFGRPLSTSIRGPVPVGVRGPRPPSLQQPRRSATDGQNEVQVPYGAPPAPVSLADHAHTPDAHLTKARSVTRKPVPAYRIESFLPDTREPQESEFAGHDPSGRGGRPSDESYIPALPPQSPFYSEQDSTPSLPLALALEEQARLSRGPSASASASAPAPSRKSSVSISGLDPALLEFLPQFAGMKATHVIMPDLPVE